MAESAFFIILLKYTHFLFPKALPSVGMELRSLEILDKTSIMIKG